MAGLSARTVPIVCLNRGANSLSVGTGFLSRIPTSPLASEVLWAASICSATRSNLLLVVNVDFVEWPASIGSGALSRDGEVFAVRRNDIVNYGGALLPFSGFLEMSFVDSLSDYGHHSHLILFSVKEEVGSCEGLSIASHHWLSIQRVLRLAVVVR